MELRKIEIKAEFDNNWWKILLLYDAIAWQKREEKIRIHMEAFHRETSHTHTLEYRQAYKIDIYK